MRHSTIGVGEIWFLVIIAVLAAFDHPALPRRSAWTTSLGQIKGCHECGISEILPQRSLSIAIEANESLTRFPVPRAIVFSDLDGCLLNHDYTYREAKPALACLRDWNVPVVLASSKTAA